MSTRHERAEHMKTWPFNWRIIRYCPWPFAVHAAFHLLYFGGRVIPGLIEKAVFDSITGAERASIGLWGFIALYVSVELARLATSFGSVWGAVTFRCVVGGLLRQNVLASILRRPGAVGLPVASGEAVSRFRDDVAEVADFPTWLPEVGGEVLTSAIAVAIMAHINLTITLVIFVPLAATIAATRFAWGRIMRYHRAGRVATGAVTGFLGELFGAVQAIKVADAEEHVVAHFHHLNEARRAARVKERLFGELIDSINGTAVTFGIGVTLLLAGHAMAAGTFTVGDFALFVYYLWFTAQLPSVLGTFMGDYKQQEVAIERLEELVRPEPVRALVADGARVDGRYPTLARQSAALSVADPGRLRRLDVRGLTYRYPGSGRGIAGIDLSLDAGSFTVITGRIGAGKTTLLRVLLGLLPADEGEIRWNGEPIGDPALFFHPPRSAYTPQVPRLFSETLRDNILLGLPTEGPAGADLEGAVRLGVLERDIAVLERGLDTLVGPRGVRLSGGQVQRTAAARMFARRADLYVFDDLSSALDVETERLLWERLDARGAGTYLVVSHRRAALRRANRIFLLDDGSVAVEGTLDELLATCPLMQRLWASEQEAPRDRQDELSPPAYGSPLEEMPR